MILRIVVCDLCYTGKGVSVLATHRYHQADDPTREAFDICPPCVETVKTAGFHPYPVEHEDNEVFRRAEE